jgi:hypothetical protein
VQPNAYNAGRRSVILKEVANVSLLPRVQIALFPLVACALCSCVAPVGPARPLEKRFADPPDSARPHTWWHWMNGNVTKEGITADLEAMKKEGIGGAQIFNVDCGIPAGPVEFMSPQWRALVKHAVREADRFGIELCMHNCAGWSSSGGPWVKPELAMQKVICSETFIDGPARIEKVLPKPPHNLGVYRDIAVLAFPTTDGENARMSDYSPHVTANVEGLDLKNLWDGNQDTLVALPIPKDSPLSINIEFPKPMPARTLRVVPGSGRNGCRAELHVSDDGKTFRSVASIDLPNDGRPREAISTGLDLPASRFFRLTFKPSDKRTTKLVLGEIELTPQVRLDHWSQKAGFDRMDNPARDARTHVTPECAVRTAQVQDISSHMDGTGRLTWDAPAGRWTLLRIGYTPTGKNNHPAPKSGQGLECDKMSKDAAEAFWKGGVEPILSDVRPWVGKSLKHILIDSYEVGSQNWTPKFREEFKSRRGYDPLPYLPAMTGRIVENMDVTERFLWDLRRTIADLFADNYFGHFRKMCHRNGLQLSVEPYGNGGFDDLTSGGRGDLPMTEFWVGQGPDPSGGKLASSIAHAYGKRFVGAESFTASWEVGRWQNDPFSIKALGDMMYCGGVNRFIFHRWAQQPWLDRVPGMTMGPWGMHMERTLTWWNQAHAWLKYLSRCQFMLQEGQFVADVCYFAGEGSPHSLPGRGGLTPVLPAGHDYDGCDADVILTRMAVRDGKIVLPDGMSYVALVLTQSERMTPVLLRKIRQLVSDGATVVGARPKASPSLTDYPACDGEVKTLADEIWGNCDGKSVKEHALGKGKVIWGRSMEEVLASFGLKPDFQCAGGSTEGKIAYIHRRMQGDDVYFVANWHPRSMYFECSFRVAGRRPELWHPDTGQIEDVAMFMESGGRTTVPLRMDPRGSVFVVFRKPLRAMDHLIAVRKNGENVLKPKPPAASTLEIRKAEYGDLFRDAPPETADVTQKLVGLVRDGRLEVSADNSLAGDPAPNIVKELRVVYTYDGKRATTTVGENQKLIIPEKPVPGKGSLEIHKALYGVLPPEMPEPATRRTVDVTARLASMVKDGRLSVVADNALAGDPAPNTPKHLEMEYVLDGVPKKMVVDENAIVEVPDDEVPSDPAAEIALGDGGVVAVRAWEAGTYKLQTASGRTLTVDVPSIPNAVEISGPWTVRFERGRNAPGSATFDKLISWTEHTDPGIKYFSGVATYARTLEVSRGLLAKGNRVSLDLGRVKSLAEVRLNGKNLGVLWKPPFRVDVTGLLKAGRNRLEIEVVNLWPNRLIGDEQLPDDCEWNSDGSLKKWPDWFVQHKPRPSAGRCTFTTWKHYKKDSPLLESGLLGPVRLQVGVDRQVKW